MEGIFTEFENENTLRTYPFAAGCMPPDDVDAEIPADLFVDAALYPINPSGVLYLSSVSESGEFRISDSDGVVMTGSQNGQMVEFYDGSPFKRHVGTLMASSEEALTEFAGRCSLREYASENTTFAANCVMPVVIDGVVSLSVGGSAPATGDVGFANGSDDDVRVSSRRLSDGRRTLRFDVLPRPGIVVNDSIRRIICVVDGQTPFRISKLSNNTIQLNLADIDRDAICSAAHRENQFEMADTCECATETPNSSGTIPYVYQLAEVYIPPDDENPAGAENAFYLVVPNGESDGYRNPLSITLVDSVTIPRTDEMETVEVGNNQVELADGALVDELTSRGVVLQVPGLSGGLS